MAVLKLSCVEWGYKINKSKSWYQHRQRTGAIAKRSTEAEAFHLDAYSSPPTFERFQAPLPLFGSDRLGGVLISALEIIN